MFTILHQSPSPMMIAPELDVCAVGPLYFIASGHNLQYKYTWDNITRVVGVNLLSVMPLSWVLIAVL